MPTTIGEMEVQMAPPEPQPVPSGKTPPTPPPDRQSIARLLRDDTRRRARLHAD
jgi:hypothetical protein